LSAQLHRTVLRLKCALLSRPLFLPRSACATQPWAAAARPTGSARRCRTTRCVGEHMDTQSAAGRGAVQCPGVRLALQRPCSQE
jgi:hypothetical protein